MADPLCVRCGKPIQPTADKTTIHGVIHHARCWDHAQAKRV